MDKSLSTMQPKKYQRKVFFRKLRSQVDGSLKVEQALTQIRGIGMELAREIVKIADINPSIRIGAIPENLLNRLEEIILDPIKHGIPKWMANRQNDPKEGTNQHLIGNELDMTLKRDADKMKRMKRFRGLKNHFRLKVRGQRTKSVKKSKSLDLYKKIRSLMKERNLNLLEVNKIYLPEFIEKDLRDFRAEFKIKEEVKKFLKEKLIGVKETRELIIFFYD